MLTDSNLIYPVINFISDFFPWLGKIINAFAINKAVNVTRHRPHPWSTVHDYVSWASLTDKHWSARHLPVPNKPLESHQEDGELPDRLKLDNVKLMFKRSEGGQVLCSKSTCLFPAFAQYLTDGFIRTRMPSGITPNEAIRKQNTSNHEIDLSPLYGRTQEQTDALRSKCKSGKGRLKSQLINGEEYADFLFVKDKDEIKQEFESLDLPLRINTIRSNSAIRNNIFAFGGDRANASPQVAMVNTLFLREHNRLAGEIEASNPEWDDDRVFETTRNAMIVMFIKIVVEEYINHISPGFRFHADPSVAWNAPWNKPNWITTEFSLLYRWHQLIPDTMIWKGTPYPVENTIMNNQLLLDGGLRQALIDMSSQPAAKLGAFNTAGPLLDFEKSAVLQGRLCKLASYSDYRQYVSLSAPMDFSDISSDPNVVRFLKETYNDQVDEVEFYVGLFAEDVDINTPLPPLVRTMVALDAFSQALTNPLLSEHVWTMEEKVFSEPGWRAINQTNTVRDIAIRNISGVNGTDFIGMTQTDWRPN